MKSNTANIFLFALLVFLVSMSIAARAAGQERRPAPDLQEIINEMGLDNDQAEQLSQMVKGHHEQMRETRIEKKALKESTNAMRSSHRQELLSILTHEQLYQFESFMHENRPKRKMKN